MPRERAFVARDALAFRAVGWREIGLHHGSARDRQQHALASSGVDAFMCLGDVV
jgi:hypothetical protein